MFLMAVITLLSSLVFLMHGSSADQLAYISAMLLSAVAFLFVIAGMLPHTSYLTILDKYIYGSFLYFASLGIQVAVSPIFDDHSGDYEAVSPIDKTLFWANISIFVSAHILWAVVQERAVAGAKEQMIKFQGPSPPRRPTRRGGWARSSPFLASFG